MQWGKMRLPPLPPLPPLPLLTPMLTLSDTGRCCCWLLPPLTHGSIVQFRVPPRLRKGHVPLSDDESSWHNARADEKGQQQHARHHARPQRVGGGVRTRGEERCGQLRLEDGDRDEREEGGRDFALVGGITRLVCGVQHGRAVAVAHRA